MTAPEVEPLRARNAVATVFVLNGLLFATLVSRVPDLRAGLHLGNAQLGLLLLAISLGSMLGMPLAGRMIDRLGAAVVVRLGVVACAVGLAFTAFAVTVPESALLAGVGLALYGFGTGTWDVAMNVEGAEVERRIGRTIMPRFHAGWSLGSVVGAGLGVVAARAAWPMPVHFVLVGAVALVGVAWGTGSFLPQTPVSEDPEVTGRSPWREPRTLAIGAMVLAFALAEGSANDWLALALIDGYDARHYVGVAGFALFVVAMTTGRMLGPILLDRFGRVPVLLGTAVAAAIGLLTVVFGASPALVAVGIVVWGLGSALGFPVGMSAAADDPARAARRVSVVSTIGYGAFLAGPPLLGFVGEHVGTLHSLLVVAAAMVPAAVLVLAVAPPRRDPLR